MDGGVERCKSFSRKNHIVPRIQNAQFTSRGGEEGKRKTWQWLAVLHFPSAIPWLTDAGSITGIGTRLMGYLGLVPHAIDAVLQDATTIMVEQENNNRSE